MVPAGRVIGPSLQRAGFFPLLAALPKLHSRVLSRCSNFILFVSISLSEGRQVSSRLSGKGGLQGRASWQRQKLVSGHQAMVKYAGWQGTKLTWVNCRIRYLWSVSTVGMGSVVCSLNVTGLGSAEAVFATAPFVLIYILIN